jgi:hypothetical protein
MEDAIPIGVARAAAACSIQQNPLNCATNSAGSAARRSGAHGLRARVSSPSPTRIVRDMRQRRVGPGREIARQEQIQTININ